MEFRWKEETQQPWSINNLGGEVWPVKENLKLRARIEESKILKKIPFLGLLSV